MFEVRVLLDGKIKGYIHTTSFGLRWSDWRFALWSKKEAEDVVAGPYADSIRSAGYEVCAVEVQP